MAANAAERQRWNDPAWSAAWRKREVLTAPVTELLLPHLRLAPGERVLDVGCGGGVASLPAARLVGTTGAVLGADISVPLVELARSRARESQLDHTTRFVVADVQTEPLEGAPFDVVMSQFGVMFFDEPVVAFGRLREQCAPGGRLGFACWQATQLNPWFAGPALAPFVAPPPPPAPGKSPSGPFSLADPERVEAVLVAAGWSAVQRTPFELTVAVEADAIVDDEQIEFMGVPPGRLDEARAAVDRHLAPLRADDGRYVAPLAIQVFTAAA